MKKCIYCAEEIQDEAVKCRYCGEFLNKPSVSEEVEDEGGYGRKEDPPKEIANLSKEELAERMFSYFKSKFNYESLTLEAPTYRKMLPYWLEPQELEGFLRSQYDIVPTFDWERKWESEAVNKVWGAWEITRGKWGIYLPKLEEEIYEKENAKLPELIELCIGWAKRYDLKKLTKRDVETFLLDKKIVLFTDLVERTLYLQVNMRMKTK